MNRIKIPALAAFLVLGLFAQNLSAQSRSRQSSASSEPENRFAVGIAPFSVLMPGGRINVRGEWAYAEDKSISVMVGVPKKTKIPNLFEDRFEVTPDENADEKTSSESFSGFGVVVENRFYWNTAPRGFYLAPYLRYNRNGITHVIENQANGYETKITGALAGFGIGGAAGAQFKMGKHATLDLTFAGIDMKLMRGIFKYSTDDPESDILVFQEKVIDKLDDLPFIGRKISSDLEDGKIKVKTPGVLVPGFRFNLTVNYAF